MLAKHSARFFQSLLMLIGLTVIFGNPAPASGRQTQAGQAHPLYLPVVVKPPLVERVVTSAGDAVGYPGYVWLNGYLNSLVSKPVYSVEIEVEYLHYPYCDPPEPCEPYKASETIHPAFPATLPGQLNPFLWEFDYAKDYASVVSVSVRSASLVNDTGKTYYPLAILSWQRVDETITGKVRNESGKTLAGARLLVFPGECDLDEFLISNICRYREATLTNAGLQPGQEADFKVENFSYQGNDIVVVGQGSPAP